LVIFKGIQNNGLKLKLVKRNQIIGRENLIRKETDADADEKCVEEDEESEEDEEEDDEEEGEEGQKDDEEKKDIKLLKYEEKEEEEEEEPMDKGEAEVQPIKKEVKEEEDELMEVKIIEIIEGKSREETLKKKLAKANKKVYKWMAGIEPNEIERTIGDWDKLSLLKMVEMADQEIREHSEKLVANNYLIYA
jgi:hypothetical protein